MTLNLVDKHRGCDYVLFGWSSHDNEIMVMGWGEGLTEGDVVIVPEGTFYIRKIHYRKDDATHLWVLTARRIG